MRQARREVPHFVRLALDKDVPQALSWRRRAPEIVLAGPDLGIAVFVGLTGLHDGQHAPVNRFAERTSVVVLFHALNPGAGLQAGDQPLKLRLTGLRDGDPAPIPVEHAELVQQLRLQRRRARLNGLLLKVIEHHAAHPVPHAVGQRAHILNGPSAGKLKGSRRFLRQVELRNRPCHGGWHRRKQRVGLLERRRIFEVGLHLAHQARANGQPFRLGLHHVVGQVPLHDEVHGHHVIAERPRARRQGFEVQAHQGKLVLRPATHHPRAGDWNRRRMMPVPQRPRLNLGFDVAEPVEAALREKLDQAANQGGVVRLPDAIAVVVVPGGFVDVLQRVVGGTLGEVNQIEEKAHARMVPSRQDRPSNKRPGLDSGSCNTAMHLRWDARPQSPLHFLLAPSQLLVRFLT